MFINASEKKTLENPYLTVEQVHQAACAWVVAQALPPPARRIIYRQAAKRIAYYQERNRRSRKSHTKRTLRRLRELDIEVDQLNSCVPDKS